MPTISRQTKKDVKALLKKGLKVKEVASKLNIKADTVYYIRGRVSGKATKKVNTKKVNDTASPKKNVIMSTGREAQKIVARRAREAIDNMSPAGKKLHRKVFRLQIDAKLDYFYNKISVLEDEIGDIEYKISLLEKSNEFIHEDND